LILLVLSEKSLECFTVAVERGSLRQLWMGRCGEGGRWWWVREVCGVCGVWCGQEGEAVGLGRISCQRSRSSDDDDDA